MSTPLSSSDADMYLREGDLATAADGGGMRGAGVREEKRMDFFFILLLLQKSYYC